MDTVTSRQHDDAAASNQPPTGDENRPLRVAMTVLRRQTRDSERRRLVILVASLVGLLALFTALSGGRELLTTNLVNIGSSAALLGIVAVGEVVVMIAGGLDISVGASAGLVSTVVAVAMQHSHQSAIIGIAAGLAMGFAAGMVNGIMVAYVEINSVIATLATYSAYAGIALLVTNGQEVGVFNGFFNTLGTGSALGLPYLLWAWLLVCAIGIVVMAFTDIGRQVYAVGGGERAAKLAGIPTRRYIAGVFIISGLCAAVAGILLTAQTGAAQPSEGSVGLELTAITAVLLGGTGLAGGSGSVFGATLGVGLLATLDNGLLLVGLQQFWQQVATGCLLVLAVALQNIELIAERVSAARLRYSIGRRNAGSTV